jgi:hypothetical protein
MAVVQEMFPGHVISQRGDLPWPARSPDLSMRLFPLRLPQSEGIH